ncbi:MAG TPA: hypothetical protein VG709_07405 [Actinomycetota bacterium]|nr:hypothetical protein [Actinomycetota bacterium]
MRKSPLMLVVLLLPACFDAFNPLEDDPEEAGVSVEVVACDVDETSGVATATAEVTSTEPHDSVLLRGELIGEDGTVLHQSATSVQNIEPGRTYRARITFGALSRQDRRQDLECDVQLDFAADIPGS